MRFFQIHSGSSFAPPKYQEACWKTLISTPRWFLKNPLPSTLFCSLLPPGCPPCRNPKLSVGSGSFLIWGTASYNLHSSRICFGATLSFRPIGNNMLQCLVFGLIDENLQRINTWLVVDGFLFWSWALLHAATSFLCSCCGVTMGFPRLDGRRKYFDTWNIGPCKYSFLCSGFQLCNNPVSLRAQLA